MNRLTVAGATALTIATLAIAAPQQAVAGSGDVAAGLLGGFAVGAFVGSVLGPPAPVIVRACAGLCGGAAAGVCGTAVLLDPRPAGLGRLPLGAAAHPGLRLIAGRREPKLRR